MQFQLPLFSLRFLAIAIPFLPDMPTYKIFEVIDMSGEVIGYAMLEMGDGDAQSQG